MAYRISKKPLLSAILPPGTCVLLVLIGRKAKAALSTTSFRATLGLAFGNSVNVADLVVQEILFKPVPKNASVFRLFQCRQIEGAIRNYPVVRAVPRASRAGVN